MRRDRLWSESWMAHLSERLEDREGGEDSSEGDGREEKVKNSLLETGRVVRQGKHSVTWAG